MGGKHSVSVSEGTWGTVVNPAFGLVSQAGDQSHPAYGSPLGNKGHRSHKVPVSLLHVEGFRLWVTGPATPERRRAFRVTPELEVGRPVAGLGPVWPLTCDRTVTVS